MTWLIIAKPLDPVTGELHPVYLSDLGFTTTPAEEPASVYFDRRVRVPMRLDRALWEGDALGGFSATDWGPAVIANQDGGLDWLDSLEWGGREVRVLHSAVVRPRLADFQEVFVGTTDDIEVSDEVEIPLLDRKALLDEPFSRGRFAGTGGVEGAAALTGVEKPVCLGIAMNIQPVEIDPIRRIYMVDPQGFNRLLLARTGGDLLESRGPDVNSFEELAGLDTLGASGFDHALCSRLGLIRLTARPQGPFTVDVEGARDRGTFVSATADLVRHVITSGAGASGANLTAEMLDDAAFQTHAARIPAPLGFFSAAPSMTILELVDQLVDGTGSWWGFRSGLLTIDRFDGAGAPEVTITDRDILSIRPQPVAPRLRSLKAGYRRYWSTLSEDQIVAGTAPEDRLELQQEWRWLEPVDHAGAKEQALLATDEEVLTLFHHRDHAAAEVVRRLALYGPKRRSFSVTLAWTPGDWLGRSLRLDYPRHGLAGGRDFIVIGEAIDAEDGTRTITLWG